MNSYPTLHEVRSAADDYWQVWQQLLGEASGLRQIVGQHSPTAIGWRVEGDLGPLEAAGRLFELGDSLYAGPANDRTVLTIRKARAVALDTLQEIKIVQRRPARSDDVLGAAGLELLLPHGVPALEDMNEAAAKLGVQLEEHHNDAYTWLSLTYKEREFKLRDHAVWDMCIQRAAELIDLAMPAPRS